MSWATYDSTHSGLNQNEATAVSTLVAPASVLGSAITTHSAVLVFVMVSQNTNVNASVTDNASPVSNTYTLIDHIVDSTTSAYFAWFFCPSITGSPTQLTASWTGTDTGNRMIFDTFTGGPATSTITGKHAAQNQNPPATTTDGVTSGTFSSSAGDLIWGATFSASFANTVGTGFTVGQTITNPHMRTEYIISGAGGTQAATFTNTNTGNTTDTEGIALSSGSVNYTETLVLTSGSFQTITRTVG